MSSSNEVAWNLLKQGPGRVESHAVAAEIQTIPQRKLARHNCSIADRGTTTDGGAFAILVSGRMRCALVMSWGTL
jgi:hypothetical protein